MSLIATGERLGRYRLEARIGAGGMAEVWRAWDPQLERPVAVKVVQPTIARDPGFAERFAREARVAASLVHPHIVPVYDSGFDGETPWLVMALLTGGDLRDPVRAARGREKPLAFLAPLAAALDHAHARGIVHRDVKPANVLFDGDGGLFLTDFGLAKVGCGLGLTTSGFVLGTPSYMSPEQAQGLAVDGRSDQFALGVVAFWLLSGRTPFEGDSGVAILHQVVHQKTPRLSKANPAVPPALDAVIERALAKEPEERYASCRAFVEAMYEVLGGTPPALLLPTDGPGRELAGSRLKTRREKPRTTLLLSWPGSARRGRLVLAGATVVAAAALLLAVRSGGGDGTRPGDELLRPRVVSAVEGKAPDRVGALLASAMVPDAKPPAPSRTASPARVEARSTPLPMVPSPPPRETVPASATYGAGTDEHWDLALAGLHAAATAPSAPTSSAPTSPVEVVLPPLAARIEPLRPFVEGEVARVRVTLGEAEAGETPLLDVVGGPGRATRIPLTKAAPRVYEATLPAPVVRGGTLGLVVTLPVDGSNRRQSSMQTFRVVPRTERAIPVIP